MIGKGDATLCLSEARVPGFNGEKINLKPAITSFCIEFYVIPFFSPLKLGTHASLRHVVCHHLKGVTINNNKDFDNENYCIWMAWAIFKDHYLFSSLNAIYAFCPTYQPSFVNLDIWHDTMRFQICSLAITLDLHLPTTSTSSYYISIYSSTN